MTACGLLDATATRARYRAYGIELACEFALPSAIPAPPPGAATRTIATRARSAAAVESLWSGGGEAVHEAPVAGGTLLSVERGGGGDHLIRYGGHPFHLSSDLGTLTCAPPPGLPAEWQHALLDWIVYSAAALAGVICLHAGAVVLDGAVVAVAAPAGCGKTTLTAELVRGGGTFFSDDVVALTLAGERVLAHPGPPFAFVDAGRWQLAEQLGTLRAVAGEEFWVQVERPAATPVPVAAVVLLERAADGPAEPQVTPAGFVELRGIAVGFPEPGDGERRRLELLGALAEQAPPLRLRAAATVPPQRLAAAIRAHLRAGGGAC